MAEIISNNLQNLTKNVFEIGPDDAQNKRFLGKNITEKAVAFSRLDDPDGIFEKHEFQNGVTVNGADGWFGIKSEQKVLNEFSILLSSFDGIGDILNAMADVDVNFDLNGLIALLNEEAKADGFKKAVLAFNEEAKVIAEIKEGSSFAGKKEHIKGRLQTFSDKLEAEEAELGGLKDDVSSLEAEVKEANFNCETFKAQIEEADKAIKEAEGNKALGGLSKIFNKEEHTKALEALQRAKKEKEKAEELLKIAEEKRIETEQAFNSAKRLHNKANESRVFSEHNISDELANLENLEAKSPELLEQFGKEREKLFGLAVNVIKEFTVTSGSAKANIRLIEAYLNDSGVFNELETSEKQALLGDLTATALLLLPALSAKDAEKLTT